MHDGDSRERLIVKQYWDCDKMVPKKSALYSLLVDLDTMEEKCFRDQETETQHGDENDWVTITKDMTKAQVVQVLVQQQQRHNICHNYCWLSVLKSFVRVMKSRY
jgi:hypothetical protein